MGLLTWQPSAATLLHPLGTRVLDSHGGPGLLSPCEEGGWLRGAVAVSAELWAVSPCCHEATGRGREDLVVVSDRQSSTLFTRCRNRKSAPPLPPPSINAPMSRRLEEPLRAWAVPVTTLGFPAVGLP